MNRTRPIRFLGMIVLLGLLGFGCGKSAAPPSPPEASGPQESVGQVEPQRPATESLPTSQTALESERALEQTEAQAPLPTSVLPPDHWLVGTSDAPDMAPAIIAPEAPRALLAEDGPAYLERIGDERVLHLKGSHYEMGVQHGTLLRDEIREAANLVRTVGMFAWKGNFDESIREAWTRTSPYIPEKYKEEMRGMAEATGLSEEEVQDFTIFPELFHCSGFALWGKATADGALLHGRVLDYMREVGLDKYAMVIISEPDGGNAFVNVAYSGMLGSVTGMNAKHVAIGEMGGQGGGLWDGMPMTLLVRECLESANTLEEARRIMEAAPRTCQYFYVISDSKADGGRGSALGVAAEPETILFLGPNESHPLLPRPFEDAVLMSAGDRYTCLADRIGKMYGKIDAQIALDIMARGVAMKSNMHNALFRPATLEFWVANSTIQSPASNRPYRAYDLNALMKERPGASPATGHAE